MPGRPYTNKELALVRECAEDGYSMSRTAQVLALHGYIRTKSGIQSASKTYDIRFDGDRGPPLGNQNHAGKRHAPPRSLDEIRARNSAKMREWRAANPDYLSRPHVRRSRRAANRRYYARKSADIQWRLIGQARNRRYRARKRQQEAAD